MALSWRAYLMSDERLLWEGAPEPGVRFGPSDLFISGFGLVFLAFSLVWEGMVFAMDAPLLFKIWGIPFIGVGLYMVAGRFFYEASRRKRTRYALTDQRILVAVDGLRRTLTATPYGPHDRVDYSPGDIATIRIGEPPVTYGRNSRGRRTRHGGTAPGFEFIKNGERVYRLIIEAQERMRKAS